MVVAAALAGILAAGRYRRRRVVVGAGTVVGLLLLLLEQIGQAGPRHAVGRHHLLEELDGAQDGLLLLCITCASPCRTCVRPTGTAALLLLLGSVVIVIVIGRMSISILPAPSKQLAVHVIIGLHLQLRAELILHHPLAWLGGGGRSSSSRTGRRRVAIGSAIGRATTGTGGRDAAGTGGSHGLLGLDQLLLHLVHGDPISAEGGERPDGGPELGCRAGLAADAVAAAAAAAAIIVGVGGGGGIAHLPIIIIALRRSRTGQVEMVRRRHEVAGPLPDGGESGAEHTDPPVGRCGVRVRGRGGGVHLHLRWDGRGRGHIFAVISLLVSGVDSRGDGRVAGPDEAEVGRRTGWGRRHVHALATAATAAGMRGGALDNGNPGRGIGGVLAAAAEAPAAEAAHSGHCTRT